MSKAKNKSNPETDAERGKIDFIGRSGLMAGISVVAVLISLGLIFTKGFVYGIDFSGGTEVQVQFSESVDVAKVRAFTDSLGYDNAMVQSFGEENEFLIRFESASGKTEEETNKLNNETIQKVTEGLKAQMPMNADGIRRVDSVGPQIGDELKRNGLLAVFYCLIMILIYVGLRFDYKYAPGAVLCLFHDAIVVLGIFSLIEHEVNVTILAAILTIIGYSLNDTIVNFDRIRENEEVFKGKPLGVIINRSINDVLSRTILTSVTTMLAVLALYFLAGGVITDFALALGIGVFVGTYSSIFVASPIVLVVQKYIDKSQAA